MKKKIIDEFKNKTEKEIIKEINKLKLDIKQKMINNAVNKSKNTCEIRSIRRSVARLYTLLNQKRYEKKT